MPGGTLGEVQKPLYLLHGRHMGRSRGGSGRQLFPDCVSRPSLEASWGAFFQNFGDLGCPLGLLGDPFWTQNGDLFQGLNFSHFLDHFWEGPAAGAGLLGPSDSAEVDTMSSHARLPLRGGGEYLKASPLPPAPSQLLAAGCWLRAAGCRLRGCCLGGM